MTTDGDVIQQARQAFAAAAAALTLAWVVALTEIARHENGGKGW